MANTDCPGCGAESNEDFLDEGDVLTCIHCGYVAIWDVPEQCWRLLRPEEHAQAMETEGFLESLSFGFAFRSWRDRDAQNLCTVLHSQLDKAGVSRKLILDLRDEIMSAGYHTHPTEADIQALGLGRHGEEL